MTCINCGHTHALIDVGAVGGFEYGACQEKGCGCRKPMFRGAVGGLDMGAHAAEVHPTISLAEAGLPSPSVETIGMYAGAPPNDGAPSNLAAALDGMLEVLSAMQKLDCLFDEEVLHYINAVDEFSRQIRACVRRESEDDPPTGPTGDDTRSVAGTCGLCGGPHRFDTSVPSALWNAVVRARGLPDYLCTTCVVEAFATANASFPAELYGAGFHGLPLSVEVNGAASRAAALLNDENARLRGALGGLVELVESWMRGPALGSVRWKKDPPALTRAREVLDGACRPPATESAEDAAPQDDTLIPLLEQQLLAERDARKEFLHKVAGACNWGTQVPPNEEAVLLLLRFVLARANDDAERLGLMQTSTNLLAAAAQRTEPAVIGTREFTSDGATLSCPRCHAGPSFEILGNGQHRCGKCRSIILVHMVDGDVARLEAMRGGDGSCR